MVAVTVRLARRQMLYALTTAVRVLALALRLPTALEHITPAQAHTTLAHALALSERLALALLPAQALATQLTAVMKLAVRGHRY